MKKSALCLVAALALSIQASADTNGAVQEDILGQLVLVKRSLQITEADCLAQLEQPSQTSAICNVHLFPKREGETLVRSSQGNLAARVTLGQDSIVLEATPMPSGYMIVFFSENGRALSRAKAGEALRAALHSQLPNGQLVVYVHTVR